MANVAQIRPWMINAQKGVLGTRTRGAGWQVQVRSSVTRFFKYRPIPASFSHPTSNTISIIKIEKALILCLGFEPGPQDDWIRQTTELWQPPTWFNIFSFWRRWATRGLSVIGTDRCTELWDQRDQMLKKVAQFFKSSHNGFQNSPNFNKYFGHFGKKLWSPDVSKIRSHCPPGPFKKLIRHKHKNFTSHAYMIASSCHHSIDI